MRRLAWLAAPVWALGASAYFMFAPIVRGVSVTATMAGNQTVTHEGPVSWYQLGGWSMARIFGWPLALALIPALIPWPRARMIAGGLSAAALGLFCLAAIFSVGGYFLPAVALMIGALVYDWRAR